jgi:hypothetical protein
MIATEVNGPLYIDEHDIDLVILCVGPNRMAVAKILRRAGWSYQGIRDVLVGLCNWLKAKGLTTAHQLADAGMTLRIEEKVTRRSLGHFKSDCAEPAYGSPTLISATVRFFGPGYTFSRRELPRRWAKEFRSP